MTILAVTNQKGGCGKTTTTIQMNYYLSQILNKKVLTVDVDPQGSLTNFYKIKTPAGVPTLYEGLVQGVDARINISNNLDIIPANNALASITTMNDIDAPEMLKNYLSEFEYLYDYIIIDCAPLITQMTHNCYTAAQKLIVPATPGKFSIEGIAQLKKETSCIQRMFNPELEIAGILLVNVDKNTKAEKELVSTIQECCEILGTKQYKSVIYHSTKVNDAQTNGKSLFEFDKRAKATIAYENFIKELVGDLNE